jgi:acyl carrier protein
MERAKVEKGVKGVLAPYFKKAVDEIDESQRLDAIDSLDWIEAMFKIDDVLDVEVNIGKFLEAPETVGELIDFIAKEF